MREGVAVYGSWAWLKTPSPRFCEGFNKLSVIHLNVQNALCTSATSSSFRNLGVQTDNRHSIDEVLGDTAVGTLPPLESIVGLPDFDWAARRYMNASSYTYYRNGAAGEWSYRNNLEVFSRFRLRPRVLTDITNIESTLAYVARYWGV
jgi:hypothetical protein